MFDHVAMHAEFAKVALAIAVVILIGVIAAAIQNQFSGDDG